MDPSPPKSSLMILIETFFLAYFGLCLIFLGVMATVALDLVTTRVRNPIGEHLFALFWGLLQYKIILFYAGDSKICQFWTLWVVAAVHAGVLYMMLYVAETRTSAEMRSVQTMQGIREAFENMEYGEEDEDEDEDFRYAMDSRGMQVVGAEGARCYSENE